MSRSVHEIDGYIDAAERLLATLREERGEALRRSLITCDACHKRTLITKLTYIQTHWYRPPHGCNGGDYWSQGEGQLVCPKCGHLNRLYQRPDVVEKKQYFGSIEDTY